MASEQLVPTGTPLRVPLRGIRGRSHVGVHRGDPAAPVGELELSSHSASGHCATRPAYDVVRVRALDKGRTSALT
jgi:hypothetical protein